MVDAGAYLLAALELLLLAATLGFASHRLRARLLPTWHGAPALLVEITTFVAILIWLSELLGTLSLLYPGALLAAAVLLAALAAVAIHPQPVEEAAPTPSGESPWSLLMMVAVIAITVFHWSVTTKHALDRGIFNFDSLWYHMPFAAQMAQEHSTTAIEHVETVFTNGFYPQNSELLHSVGILLSGRDTLSLFVNLGWLGVGFLAAWCVGRPYGRGSLTVVAAAILFECHTLVVRDPGSGKNDLAAAALLLVGIAILVTAWNQHRTATAASASDPESALDPDGGAVDFSVPGERKTQPRSWVGWPLAFAGLAVGLAAGTRVTVLAMAAALSLTAIVLSPGGRRRAAALWWFVPALLGGGYWYLRNLVATGNPLPEVKSIGPVPLPHPDQLQEGRPDFDIVHYATDTGVWRHYFAPGLHDAFGSLWPLVILAAAVAALVAIFAGRDRLLRWLGGVALFGLVAYLFTPLSAAGADGEPVGFGINIRYVVPALLAGIVLLPLPRRFDDARWRWGLMAALVLVFLLSNRPDEALHDPARLFALLAVVLLVAIPAALLWARSRGASFAIVAAGAAGLALLVVVLGYPAQRHYLEGRFANTGAADTQIPGMDLDSAYRWARGVEDSRIGLAGTTAGFAGYGFYGTDLSNRVVPLGRRGPHGSFNALPSCEEFRRAVNEAELDYLVTSPFLNFLHPGSPIPSPEARWLRGQEGIVTPVLHSGQVTVWKLHGQLEPGACGAANEPLREIPNTPSG